MNGSKARGLFFCLALAVAFAAGRLWPPTKADAAEPAPFELAHDGQLLWAKATDPDRQILVVGWAKEDWFGLPEETPLFFLPKSGSVGLPVPVAVESIDGAMAYELRPLAVWDADLGFRPCVGGPIACDWIPLPPLPPRPPKMLTLGIVPAP